MSKEKYEPIHNDEEDNTAIADNDQQSDTTTGHTRRGFLKMMGGVGAMGALASPGIAQGEAFFSGLDSRLRGASVGGEYRGKRFKAELEAPPKNAPGIGYGAGQINFDIIPRETTSTDDFKISLFLKNPDRRVEYVIPGSMFGLWINSRKHILGETAPVDLSFHIKDSQEKGGKLEPVFTLSLQGTQDELLAATTGVSNTGIIVFPLDANIPPRFIK